MNHVKSYEVPLENTPDKMAKIIFTLNVRYIGECSEDSVSDISFQGNINGNTLNTGFGNRYNQEANMNQTSDMTFRPIERERKMSHRKSNQ